MSDNKATYDLTPTEQQMVQYLRGREMAAKARIYDLQVSLETARRELTTAQDALNGALSVMAHAHGLQNATLSQDSTCLTGVAQETK